MAPVSRPLRVIVVGVGRFGELHAACVAHQDGAELVGVVDPSSERARTVATRHRARWSTDLSEAIARWRPDAAIVATPGATHRAVALELLAGGVPLLIEKPVGMCRAEVDEIAVAAGDVPVLPGHILRFSPWHRWARDVARSGVIGALTSIRSRRYRDRAHLDAYPDIDPVHMTMVHDIDLACWITGPADLSVIRAGPGRGDEIVAAGTSADATAWILSTAWTFPSGAEPADRLEIIGADGFVVVDAAAGCLASAGVAAPPAPDRDEVMLHREVEHFLACVRTGTASDVITLDDAAVVVGIADSVWAQAQASLP